MSTSRLAVCFEQIQGNYWYGAYGDFRVIMMKDCEWVNATRMCKSGGKELYHWKENANSKRLIKSLENLLEQEASNAISQPAIGIPSPAFYPLKYITTANYTNEDKLIAGIYVHCDLVPSIAGWISSEF